MRHHSWRVPEYLQITLHEKNLLSDISIIPSNCLGLPLHAHIYWAQLCCLDLNLLTEALTWWNTNVAIVCPTPQIQTLVSI